MLGDLVRQRVVTIRSFLARSDGVCEIGKSPFGKLLFIVVY